MADGAGTVTPAQAIDAANAVFGPQRPGERALHAKGVVCSGSFKATPAGAFLSSAAHLQGDEIPVTVRFSNGGGSFERPDFLPDPRGMAVKFYLPDGSRTDIVAVNTPVFPVSTPEAFVRLIEAPAGRLGAILKLPKILLSNPQIAVALAKAAPALRPPDGYWTISYHGLHAFLLRDETGASRYVRYRLLPVDGVKHISVFAALRRGRDYLIPGLTKRLGEGPVRFELEAQIAVTGDPVDDCSISWPRSRERVLLGTLTITGVDHTRERDGDVLVFDPTRVTPGIECSPDPILAFRSPAYRESVARRS